MEPLGGGDARLPAAGDGVPNDLPDLDLLLREAAREGLRWPTTEEVARALAAAALVSPAALGGMPVLPVRMEDERRRQLEELQQESGSTVGIHHEVEEAASSLALSQRRLAEATRETLGTHAREVSEEDVFRAARLVDDGLPPLQQRRAFRAALGRVVADTVDLSILQADASRAAREASRGPEDEPSEDDLEAWLATFE